MPVSSRYSSSPEALRPPSTNLTTNVTFTLILIGTSALLVLLVVLITGGFVIDAGPLHFSSRRWAGPWAVAAAAWLAAGIVGARVSFDEPLARLLPWPDATWAVAPLGYRPGPAPGEVVPTYPPGLPLMMAATRVAGGEWAPFFVVPLFGAVAVYGTFLLGAKLHSRRAGLVAAVLLATSPILLFQLVQPMSDVPALAWWTLALLFAFLPGHAAALAAGAAAGVALLARPNLLPLVMPLAWFSAGWPLRQPRRLLPLTTGLAAAGALLAALQWRIYGSPVASGHGAFSDFFALSNVWPNLAVYSSHLLRGEAATIVLAVVAAAIALTGRRSPQQIATGRPLLPAVTAAAVFGAAVVLCYLPYVVFRDWFIYGSSFLPFRWRSSAWEDSPLRRHPSYPVRPAHSPCLPF